MKRLTFRPTYPGSGQHVAETSTVHVVITWVGNAFEIEHTTKPTRYGQGFDMHTHLAYRKTWKAAVSAAVRMSS